MNVAGSSGLTVLQNGNVGVGIAIPEYKFTVASDTGAKSLGIYNDNSNSYFKTTSGTGFVMMPDSGNTNGTLWVKGSGFGSGILKITDGSGNYGGDITAPQDWGSPFIINVGGSPILKINPNTLSVAHKTSLYGETELELLTGGSQRLFINSSGSVGIGTTSPYAKLSVVGETVAQMFTATSTTATSTFAGGVTLATGGGSVGLGCSNPDHIFEIGGTGTGCNTGAGSYVNALGDLAFTANSSREWKENITTYGKADILSRIKNTPARTFDWKPEYCSGGNCLNKLGFIAEEFYGVLGRGNEKHVNGQDVTMALWLGMQNFINVFDITSAATGTPALLIDALGNWKIGNDGALTVKELRTEKLCVGSVCVTEEQFKKVFGQPESTSDVASSASSESSSSSAQPLPEASARQASSETASQVESSNEAS